MKIASIVGARPQFIKASPVSRAIEESNLRAGPGITLVDEILIHTGQHYDYEMSDVFFESLDLRLPKHNLGVGSGSHGEQLARMIERLETVLKAEGPDLVLVYGDTNSTLAGAIVADRLHIPVVHVEAGLRSFNRRMPEESNRVLTDHLSSLLFAPTQTAVDNLRREGITMGVFLVGDVMYEAAISHGEIAEEKSTVLRRLAIAPKNFSLVTIHRAENTDDSDRMSRILSAVLEISQLECVVWPMHPRTRQRISAKSLKDLTDGGMRIIDPVPYLDMLLLEKSANVILTDSGGVQKEAMWFRVPCVTLRDETEWIETVESGWNKIAGSRKEDIVALFDGATRRTSKSEPPRGAEELASELIVQHLRNYVPGPHQTMSSKCEFSF
jgi:UDP-N-acetylglucosamine 2-epimerase